MQGPLVSIILPTYNGNHIWLSQAIDSVISQTYTHRELIIINDASTNDIEKTILDFQKKDERIKYLKNERNMERSFSKNR
jgi:glycosyltransferase involved in cell wall biosynthesis